MFGKYFIWGSIHLLCTILVLKAMGYILPSLTIHYHSGVVGSLFSIVVAYYTFGFTKQRFLNGRIRPNKKAVLITGCDSGFGYHLARRLDSKGFHVFASCLFPSGSGAATLKENCSQRLKVFEMDVTKDESVEKALQFVQSNLDSCELWAVVNNAGIHVGYTLEMSFIPDFERSLEVNSMGPVRVTKAFLPLLKESKGRVVTITSAAGRTICPNLTPYVMSKHATAAFSDCLRQELQRTGIKVISIEPELFRTPLTDPKTVNEKLKNQFDALSFNKDFDERFRKLYKRKTDFFISFASSKIDVVLDDLESAIALEYPSIIYKPRANLLSRFLMWIYESYPTNVRDFSVKVTMFILDSVL